MRDDQGFGIAQAIRVVERGGNDVMMLAETKIQLEAYLHNRLSYNVTCLAAQMSSSGGAQGSVGMVTRDRPVWWGFDSMRYHRPNVVSCEIFT